MLCLLWDGEILFWSSPVVGTGAVVGTANSKKCVIKITLASFQTNTMFVIAYNSQSKAVIEKKRD